MEKGRPEDVGPQPPTLALLALLCPALEAATDSAGIRDWTWDRPTTAAPTCPTHVRHCLLLGGALCGSSASHPTNA